MREWRRRNGTSYSADPERRRRGIARAYANVYLRRGKINRERCERCGAADSEMHHDDYDKPLNVRWLCRECHLQIHRIPKQTVTPSTTR